MVTVGINGRQVMSAEDYVIYLFSGCAALVVQVMVPLQGAPVSPSVWDAPWASDQSPRARKNRAGQDFLTAFQAGGRREAVSRPC